MSNCGSRTHARWLVEPAVQFGRSTTGVLRDSRSRVEARTVTVALIPARVKETPELS